VNKSKRNRMVNEELKQIPQGSIYQNMLRAGYHNIRRHELIRKPELPAKNSLMSAIQIVRQDKADYLPIYDKGFFGA
jgi:hypothetical protein